jgi:hypothetical protein
MNLLTLYVPATEETFGIKPGSAIVGTLHVPGNHGPERLTVDFEGGVHNPAYFSNFANRVLHAAGRHVQRYPTVARMSLEAEHLRPVASYDADSWTIVDLYDEPALMAWVAQWRGAAACAF